MVTKIDVLVIGAGPGGYPAAIRASQLGKSVIIVDRGFIGGECLNWGCIPSKALISAASFYHKLQHDASTMGINVEGVSLDIGTMQKWKESVQTRLIDGIKALLKAHKVKTIIGEAKIIGKKKISVKTDNSTEEIEAKNIIIATGSSFISLPGFEIDEKNIVSAKGALSFEEIPKSLVCIGGGIIGMELGTVYAKLGSKVTIVELMDDLMPGVDPRLVAVVKKKAKNLGMDIFTSSKATALKSSNNTMTLTIETKKGKEKVETEKILLAIGKKANIQGLGLENAGVKTDDKGFIITNLKQQTNIEGIYAIGDCTGMPFLAHRATKQGIIAAEVIGGLNVEADFKAMPGAIFTDPEISFAGLNEQQAKDAGFDVITTRAAFAASGRAMTHLEEDGFVKVITESKSGVLLGVEIVGPHASDLISEVALGLEMGATVEDLGFTVHPHPTLPEMIMEAAEAAHGKAIHVPNPKKIVKLH
jgi:dihydrolipoamide dehydrogenase